jgi:hypothetical protein
MHMLDMFYEKLGKIELASGKEYFKISKIIKGWKKTNDIRRYGCILVWISQNTLQYYHKNLSLIHLLSFVK